MANITLEIQDAESASNSELIKATKARKAPVKPAEKPEQKRKEDKPHG